MMSKYNTTMSYVTVLSTMSFFSVPDFILKVNILSDIGDV